MAKQLLSQSSRGQPTIGLLAESVARNTAIYEAYLNYNGHALPSHEASAQQPPQAGLPLHIAEARDAAIEASQELSILLLGPARSMLQNSCEVSQSLSSQDLCHLMKTKRVHCLENVSEGTVY